jgi:hypothetical protein
VGRPKTTRTTRPTEKTGVISRTILVTALPAYNLYSQNRMRVGEASVQGRCRTDGHFPPLVVDVIREPHLLRQNLGSVDRRIRTESSTSDQSCMPFSRNPIDRCLRTDSADGLFCSCAMVSRCSDVRGWMDPSVRRSCIRTQDAGVLSRLEISVRRLALVDEQGSRSRIKK